MEQLAMAIAETNDGDSPENKVRVAHLTVVKMADMYNVDLRPLAPPDFGKPVEKHTEGLMFGDLPILAKNKMTADADASGIGSLPTGEEMRAAFLSKFGEAKPPASVTSEDFAVNIKAATGAIKPDDAATPAKRIAVAPKFRAWRAWSSEAPTEQIEKWREELLRRLREEAFAFTKNSSTEMARLTEEEANALVGFLFERVFGAEGFARVTSIVDAIRHNQKGEKPVTSAMIASNLAMDAQVPESLRYFFRFYSASCLKDLEEETIKTSPLTELINFHNRMQMVNQHVALTQNSHDQGVRDFLAANGFKTERGVGWSSVIQRYLVKALDLTPMKLRNTLQQSQPFHSLAIAFGPGILVFVPGEATNL
jgi:hypothetical protein